MIHKKRKTKNSFKDKRVQVGEQLHHASLLSSSITGKTCQYCAIASLLRHVTAAALVTTECLTQKCRSAWVDGQPWAHVAECGVPAPLLRAR